jgi:uncharacterized UBP type Zn finger protein
MPPLNMRAPSKNLLCQYLKLLQMSYNYITTPFRNTHKNIHFIYLICSFIPYHPVLIF